MLNKFFVILFKLYKYMISPFLPEVCRFHPSCSIYAVKAFESHNFIYALYLTSKRILKCNPLFQGGIDLVPINKREK